jgi:hypothetical protein
VPTYDDSRLTYNDSRFTYQGLYVYGPLAGAQPAGSGTLVAHKTTHVTLTGAQPSGTGQLLQQATVKQQLAGAHPAGSGSLTTRLFKPVTLGGNVQPAGTGALFVNQTYQSHLTGNHPPPTGQLLQRATYRRTLTGSQPPASGALTQRVSYHVLLAASQPSDSGELGRSYIHRVTLTGVQPVISPITYNEAGYTYEDATLLYEVAQAGFLVWWVLHPRILEGYQPAIDADLSVELTWKWNPYVWAQYVLSITDRPEAVTYEVALDADDHTITYDVDEGGLHDDVVYRVGGPRIYTRPPAGVHQKP